MTLRVKRPSSVSDAIEFKYEKVKGLNWANTGHEEIQIRFQDCKLNSDQIIQQYWTEQKESNDESHFLLDLGTGNGNFIHHVHKKHNIPYSKLVGVSAVDSRPNRRFLFGKTSFVPDKSYHVGNIETMEENPFFNNRKFQMIFSEHTFYHLVDPLGTLQTVYSLLKHGGIGIIRHVPLDSLIETKAETAAASILQRQLDLDGYSTFIFKMLDSPGNYGIIIKKGEESPLELILPIQYTGKIADFGGYLYAVVEFCEVTLNFYRIREVKSDFVSLTGLGLKPIKEG